MLCPRCGKEIGESKFCPECGANLSANPGYQQPPKKKHTVAYIIIGLVVIALVAIVVVAAINANQPKELDSQPVGTNTPDQGPQQSTGAGKVGDTYVEILSAVIDENSGGDPVLVVTYRWTNNSDDTTSAFVELMCDAYQDGIELDIGYGVNSYDAMLDMTEIRPGVSLEVQACFELRNTTSDVEVEITEFLGLDDDCVAMVFELD